MVREVDPYDLLIEWMEWWAEDDRAPAKLPNGLQVRTAVELTVERGWVPKDREDS